MRLSPDKINHIAHLIANALNDLQWVQFQVDKNEVRKLCKKLITEELRLDERVEELARQRIRSMARHIPEGSSEWEVLHRKYYEEEMAKLRGLRT